MKKHRLIYYSLQPCEERAVYICPSTCHVPCFSAQLPLCYSFTNSLRGRECRLWTCGWVACRCLYRTLPTNSGTHTHWVVSVACLILFPPLASLSLLLDPSWVVCLSAGVG